jgi:hypothetical protein
MSPEQKTEYGKDLPVLIAIGIAFLVLGILALVPPVTAWFSNIGNWFATLISLSIIPGFIMIAVAIGLYFQNIRLQHRVVKAVSAGDYGSRVALNELAKDYDLSPGDMRRLLTDLRMAGELKVSFDSTTGEVVFPALGGISPNPQVNGHIYCSFCGLQLSKDSIYCPGCGANLH